MAIYYLGMKTFGRARGKRGSRATSGAAYRAGERIRDERSGAVYDHRDRTDVMHKEIVLPSEFASTGRALDWARSRSALWNAAEIAERNKNARVAREFTVALPHELPQERRATLARRFAQEISDRYGNAVDLTIHAPRGDPRNFHAHLFTTTREITPQGLGRKTTLELSGTERHQLGLSRWAEELASLRERWAALANETLREAHIEARITALGRDAALSRALAPRLPLAAYHMERRGTHSVIAQRIREKFLGERARRELTQFERPNAARQRDQTAAAEFSSGVAGTFIGQIRARTQATWEALRTRVQERRLAAKPEPRIVAPQHTRAAARVLEHRPSAEGRPRETSEIRSARKWAAEREAGRWGPARSTEELQREAVRNWLAYRQALLRDEGDHSREESARGASEHDRAPPGTPTEPSHETQDRGNASTATRGYELDL